jgi:hypothetical protein
LPTAGNYGYTSTPAEKRGEKDLFEIKFKLLDAG